MGSITIYAIKSAICLALLYLPYTLLMRRDTFHAFNRVLLLSIVVLSLVLPLFKPLSFLPQGEMIPNPIESLEKNLQHSLTYRVESEEELTLTNNTPSPNLTQGGETIRMETTIVTSPSGEVERGAGEPIWPTILVLIYIIGVVVCIAWKAFQLVRLYRYIPSNCLWKDTIDGIQVYAHFDDVCPFSWMNTVVITDEDFKNNPSVMQHERAHICLHHSWDNLFVSFVEVLQWFNPCIWMLDYSLREVHEYEADASVLSHGVTLQNYQSLLIRKAMGTSSYAFANGFNHSLLKKRIKMMMKKKSNRWSSTKALYLLPVAAIALAAFATPEFAEKADVVSETSLLSPLRGEDLVPSPWGRVRERSSSATQPLWVLNGNLTDWTYMIPQWIFSSNMAERNTAMDSLMVYIQQNTDIPEDSIESISILKEPVATLKWGSRGKNGVIEIVAAVKNGRFPKVEIGEIIYGHLYDNDGPVNATISEVKDDNKTVVQSVSPNEMGEFQLKVINPDNKLLITSPNHQQVRQPIRRTFYNIQMWKLVPIES